MSGLVIYVIDFPSNNCFFSLDTVNQPSQECSLVGA